jgi:RNA polymerase-binding transcription factor DksA
MGRRGGFTKSQLEALREALEDERARLTEQVTTLDATAVVGAWGDGGFDDDQADSGVATLERDRAQSLAQNARRILDQTEAALRRMDAGTYGKCERCGESIELERLKALPYATLCLADKQMDERTA